MKIFELTQQKFLSIGYLSDVRSSGHGYYHIVVPIVISILLIAMEVMAAIYAVLHFQMGDIENSLYAGLDVPGTILVIGTYLTVLYNKQKLRKVIDSFQEIFDSCKPMHLERELLNWVLVMVCASVSFAGEDKPSAVFFVRADKFVQKLLRVMFFIAVPNYVITSVGFAAYGAYSDFSQNGHIEPRKLFLPLRLR